jgi:hypothetical protein
MVSLPLLSFLREAFAKATPLSPYLFVIAINELSIRLQSEMNCSNLLGVTLGPGCPAIHSLLFADDLMLCGAASVVEATNIRNVLHDFCSLSGQAPNL